MKPLLTCIAITMGFIATTTYANEFGDAELGKIKSPSCVFCHGPTGEAVSPNYPNLSGQNAQYLYQSMKAYQQGNRSGALADMMKTQLSKLNDQDLKDIATYYSSQE